MARARYPEGDGEVQRAMRAAYRQRGSLMSLIVTCQCGRQFMASPDLAGKRVPCPACGGEISVPRQETAASSAAVSDPPIVVACVCGGRFQAPPHLLGKRVPCPTCGQLIHVVRSTVEEPPSLAGLDDSSFAATPVSTPPRAGGGAWVQSRRREEPINMRPVIIASSIGGGAVVLLILAMIVTSIVSSCRDDGAKETENRPTPPSITQPSPVTPTGQTGNAPPPVSAPKPDAASPPPKPDAARPPERPATTVKPPESSPPAAQEPAVEENRKTTAKEAAPILIGGLPVPLAKALAKEFEALNHATLAEIGARATAQRVTTEFEVRAIAKAVGREQTQKKAFALMAKYGVDFAQLNEILSYAVTHGWIELRSL